jgi:hypothetical protein
MLIIERASHEFELSRHAKGTTLAMRWPIADR